MKCRELIEQLEVLAPMAYACEWDNPGLLAGRMDKEVKKVMVALDATDSVVEQAVSQQVDFLLTHHPLVFSPLKKVNDQDPISRKIMDLIQSDICYYAMHTNFDVAPGCMADLASQVMGMIPEKPLEMTGEQNGVGYGVGKVGALKAPMTLTELGQLVKTAFHLPWVTVYGLDEIRKPIQRIAISPGAGGSMLSHAVEQNAEVLITGDIRHHDGLDAVAEGLAVIDAGHYGLEQIFVPFFHRYFAKQNPETFEVVPAKESAPSQIL